jgi:glycosyltransferase involved in cell wall biosynthesis
VVRRCAFAVPGDLMTPTGGYGYDRRVMAELRALGWTIDFIDLGDGFPAIAPARNAEAFDRLMARDTAPIVIDGLALGVLSEAAGTVAKMRRLIALVHHPLALETDLSDAQRTSYRSSECAALAAADHVITTSAATAAILVRDYAVANRKLTVAVPGTDRHAPAPRPNNKPLHLLAVGALVPRKGHDILLAALAQVVDLPWRLTIVGERRDETCAAALERIATRFGGHVRLTGAISDAELNALYRDADVFALASRFEGYGMAYAEAIAHGLPVVGTRVGANDITVPEAAGMLAPPDDARSLAQALRRVICDTALRDAMAKAAAEAAQHLPTWRDCALSFAQVLERDA